MHKTIRLTVIAALFAALVCVTTMMIRIPTPSTGGYVHLGNCFCLLAAFLLPAPWGIAASGIGTMLADLIGYPVYAPASLIIMCAVAAIAGGVLLVAVFVYTAIRHKLAGGVIAAAITLVTLALTTALTVIVRVPVSSTCANALFLSTVLGAVYGVAVAGKMRKAETNEENEGLSAKEIVAKEMPEKPLLIATCALAVGIVLIGAMGISPVQWLSLIALLGLVSAYFTAGILFPSVYPPIFEKLQKKRAAKPRL